MTRAANGIEEPTDQAGRSLQRLALGLFDRAAPVHRLPAPARRLLRIACAFYLAGKQADHERPDRAGRDLALARPLDDLAPAAQALVAGVVALQREKAHRARETTFLRLSRSDQETALRLAAILQIADGLSGSATAQVLDVQAGDDQTTILIEGPQAGADSAAAAARDRLWRAVLGKVTIRPAEPADRAVPAAPAGVEEGWGAADERLVASGDRPPLSGGEEPIAEAARRVLRRFFDKLLAREDAVRAGDDDPEDVHQMRVATRRLRASLQVVEAVYDPRLVRRYRRGLRRIAESLGAVRDGDVFLKHVAAYRDTLPEDDRAGMAPLVEAIEAERARARARLLDDLERGRYHKLKHAFATFLTTPGAGQADLGPARVRDFAGSAIWRRYEQWRAYEVVVPHADNQALHQARIAGKRLRYTLEFFADALGPEVEQALAPLAALQENLGALQDDVVAEQRIRALELEQRDAIRAYLQARAARHAAHLAELPQLWAQVAGEDYRRQLFELIVRL